MQKPIIKKIKKTRKMFSFFKDIIWLADHANMQLISKCTKGTKIS